MSLSKADALRESTNLIVTRKVAAIILRSLSANVHHLVDETNSPLAMYDFQRFMLIILCLHWTMNSIDGTHFASLLA